MFNFIYGMLHNTKDNTYHPIVFTESPLPGPYDPDKPVRHKSRGHHTKGFPTREEAIENIRTHAPLLEKVYGPVRFYLDDDYEWDGEGIPSMVQLFVTGELKESIDDCLSPSNVV